MKEFDPSIIPEDTFCSESHIGPTPSGGAYSTAYYTDKWHEPCRKEDAAYIHITEFDKDGGFINDVHGQRFNDIRELFTPAELEYYDKIDEAYNIIMNEGKSRLLTLHKLGLPKMTNEEINREYYKGRSAGIIQRR